MTHEQVLLAIAELLAVMGKVSVAWAAAYESRRDDCLVTLEQLAEQLAGVVRVLHGEGIKEREYFHAN